MRWITRSRTSEQRDFTSACFPNFPGKAQRDPLFQPSFGAGTKARLGKEGEKLRSHTRKRIHEKSWLLLPKSPEHELLAWDPSVFPGKQSRMVPAGRDCSLTCQIWPWMGGMIPVVHPCLNPCPPPGEEEFAGPKFRGENFGLAFQEEAPSFPKITGKTRKETNGEGQIWGQTE